MTEYAPTIISTKKKTVSMANKVYKLASLQKYHLLSVFILMSFRVSKPHLDQPIFLSALRI